MAKNAKKTVVVEDKKMIAPDRYEALEYDHPVTGKRMRSKGSGDAIHRLSTWIPDNNDHTLKEVAAENEIAFDPTTYTNSGMAKMALLGKLRAKLRKGENVEYAGIVVKSLETRVPLPKAAKAAA